MKCAIYGAGSLGTVLGAYMTKGGIPVELVNRNRAHVDALREKGAHITGTVDFSTPVTAITPEEMTAPYDVIFLMTKQLHNKEVVTFLKPLLAPDGVIVTFQNGIPEPGIAEIVGEPYDRLRGRVGRNDGRSRRVRAHERSGQPLVPYGRHAGRFGRKARGGSFSARENVPGGDGG